jgi:hypothetical protein
VEKPKHVQKIRLSRRIGTDDEHPLWKLDIDKGEVAPVLEVKAREAQVGVLLTAGHLVTMMARRPTAG